VIRRVLFWLHLSIGIAAGVFIFVMAATGVVLSFERQTVEFGDRDVRFVSGLQDAQPRQMNDLLQAMHRAGMGDPTAIILRSQPQAATQFSIGRTRTVYVDPYSGAVLGVSSERLHGFFMGVERLHRALGAPLGSRGVGRRLTGISNLLFCVLIPLGLILWLPRKWSWKTVRPSIGFRSRLRGKAREWNWHHVVGIWCCLPLLVIALTGVVMSYDWANALLFRVTGSTPTASGRNRADKSPRGRQTGDRHEPNYDRLFTVAKGLNPNWRTITLDVARNGNSPLTAVIDTGTGGQPQRRVQYLLNPDTGVIEKTSTFADGSLGQRLRSFVRFGHTGEYYGLMGQLIAALASLGACVLVYTGLSLSVRRLTATLKRKRLNIVSSDETYAEQSTT
jgi:uncharacterized iron-regulated membrane protein